MIKAIIFDPYGVIVHTDKLHFEAWKKISAKTGGAPFDESINNQLGGASRKDSLDIILENAGIALSHRKRDACQRKNSYYVDFLAMTPSDSGMEASKTLMNLRRSGYKLAIGSSSRNAKTILRQAGILENFEAIWDGGNIY
ncbi:MAG: HAD hydrolase-like protein [Clostridiales bacterium]|jgi:beta-phosphoglucomutase-like phosphatase (HAD superfamily)|nr:HAD hydrolase-like protein [Clostridiales bacterium]